MIATPMRALSIAFQEAWRLRWPFLLSRLVFGLLVLAVLAPITSFALRIAIIASGQPALSDFDIAMYLFSPVGFFAALLCGGLALTSAVLNIAFMMAIALHARKTGRRRFEEGVARIIPRIRVLLAFAIRLLLRIILILLPFLGAIAYVAFTHLGEYDINFYLASRPPEFIRAMVIIGALALLMAGALIWALLGWALALPMVLFQHSAPGESFAHSRAAMKGRRLRLLIAVALWGALSALAISLFAGVAHFVAGRGADALAPNLESLAAWFFLVIALWTLVNLVITATTTGTLACLLMGWADWPESAAPAGKDPAERKTLRRALIGGMAIAGIFAAIGAADLSHYQGADAVEVIAHRGAAGARPENTMAAFALAIEQRANWIELDVQESADGDVIVTHDSDFMKLAGNPLKVWDATAADLADIDVGSWFGPEYAAERTPLLSDVLDLARDTGSGVLIELKYYGHDQKLEDRVADVVEAAGMAAQVQLMSLKYAAVQKMKAVRPDWTVGLLASAALGRPWRLEADFLAMNKDLVSHRLIRETQKAGKPVYVWTVNDPLAMSEMLSLGVDGLITDEPALARNVIAQRAELGRLERIVLALASGLGLGTETDRYRDASP